MTKERVSKTTYPEKQLPQDEWFRQFGVASFYTKPTPYYEAMCLTPESFSDDHRDQHCRYCLANLLTI